MAKKIYRILDDLSPSEMKLKNLPRRPDGLHNMHFNEYGQLVKRKGYSKYNTDTISETHKIVGLHRFYPQDPDDKEFLCACDTKIYKLATTTGHAPTALESDTSTDLTVTADSETFFANFYDTCYIVNGVDGMFKYNGTFARTVGIAIPAAPTLAAATPSGGNIDVGNAASDRVGTASGYYTVVDKHNPSNADGTITSVEIYAKTELNDVKVAIFYIVSGDNLSTRDHQSIGTVAAGSKQTFTVNLDVIKGDYIGIYWTSGTLEHDDTGTGLLYTFSDDIPCTDVPFSPSVENLTISLYATGTTSAGALANRTYKFKITYVDEDGYEGNGSASTAITLTGSDDGVTVTIPVASDAKITKRRIYRTTVNGAKYYYDGEVGDNSTTTFVSVQADTTICQNTVLHTDHNAPPSTPHLITKRRTRIILADNDAFYISKIADVEYFPLAWFIYTGSRDKITGMLEQKEWLPVFTEDTIERLIGQDEGNFDFKNCYSVEGNIALRSLVSCNNLLVYLGCDGIYYFDGNTSKILNIPLSEYIRANINPTYAYLSAGTFFDNKYLLSYPKGDSKVPNETIYIDFRTGKTGIYNFGFGSYCRWDKGTDGLQLYSGSTTEGRVYSALTGTTDDTAAIACYDLPEPIDLGIPDIWKQWYNIYIKVKTAPSSTTALTMYYTLDDGTETSATAQTLTADTTKWYKFNLGGGGQRARALQPRPYVSNKFDVTFMGYAFVYDTEAPEY